MRPALRDRLILVGGFLAWNGLLCLFIPARSSDRWLPGVWQSLALMSFSSLVFLLMNLWLVNRGKFRWHVEGIASALVLVFCGLVLFPVYTTAVNSAAHARRSHRRPPPVKATK
jgi:uncharacterized membrane protein YozB (DUF420 family)